jgi:hypothetical protein
MAAQMVSSAVAQEAVNQALSKLKARYGHKSDGTEHMERMEIVHIKLEAALLRHPISGTSPAKHCCTCSRAPCRSATTPYTNVTFKFTSQQCMV